MSSTTEPMCGELFATPSVNEPLVVERTIGAAREAVFQAWTETAQLLQWFGPEGFSVKHAEVELKQGGRYQIAIESPSGTVIQHYGVYREIKAPEKLSFTWILKNQQCEGSRDQCANTLVTIEFFAVDASHTRVVLTHEFLPSEPARAGHAFAWGSSFDRLQKFIS